MFLLLHLDRTGFREIHTATRVRTFDGVVQTLYASLRTVCRDAFLVILKRDNANFRNATFVVTSLLGTIFLCDEAKRLYNAVLCVEGAYYTTQYCTYPPLPAHAQHSTRAVKPTSDRND